MMQKSRDDAWEIVRRHVNDRGLQRHMAAVGIAMRAYAEKLGGDPDYWETVGIVHDFDWEMHPDLYRHPIAGSDILRAEGWDEDAIRTVLSHYSEGTGIAREKPIDFALMACDEITGLIIATTLVRPTKDIAEVTISSVRKKWKDRGFAAGVDRDDVALVTEEFSQACFGGQLDLWTHVENVLAAMQGRAAELDLDGRLAVPVV